MPKLSPNQVPTYRLHKQSGQGVVTLSGRDVLLGTYGSPASREKYNRVVGEWQANGRTLPAPTTVAVNVDMLAIAFWKHAHTYYPDPEGKPERDHYKGVLRILRKLYADAPASSFGPLALRAVREEMIALGWARPYVKRQVGRLRRVFKWAAECEMVPAAAWHALQAVEGLRQGKTDAPEPDPVRPVPEANVAAVLPFTCRQLPRLHMAWGGRFR
jgi:hypothetical protein